MREKYKVAFWVTRVEMIMGSEVRFRPDRDRILVFSRSNRFDCLVANWNLTSVITDKKKGAVSNEVPDGRKVSSQALATCDSTPKLIRRQ